MRDIGEPLTSSQTIRAGDRRHSIVSKEPGIAALEGDLLRVADEVNHRPGPKPIGAETIDSC
jgi:hypothetical protein